MHPEPGNAGAPSGIPPVAAGNGLSYVGPITQLLLENGIQLMVAELAADAVRIIDEAEAAEQRASITILSVDPATGVISPAGRALIKPSVISAIIPQGRAR